MTKAYDVMVLGGGIIGASTAYALANKGKSVLLIDQFEAGHPHGSSYGDGRVVRFNYTEAIYVEMAMMGYPAWQRLSQAAGKTLIQKTGLLEYGAADCVPIKASEAQLKQYKLAYKKLTPDEANQRFPQFHFAENATIIYQAEGAVAFATPAVKALWRLFRGKGGTTITGKRIADITVNDESVTLTDTDGVDCIAAKVVIAAGGWAKQMLATTGLDIPIEVTQEILAYFPPKDDSISHQIGIMPVAIDYHDHLEDPFYCLPIVDIGGVKMGWHHTGSIVQPDDERVIPEAILDGMRGWIARFFPHLQTEPLEIHTCLYSNTPDYHFILDKHPQHDNIVIAAGFSGHGFKFGPILGELLARLTLDETLPLSLETFALSRFNDPSKIHRRVGA